MSEAPLVELTAEIVGSYVAKNSVPVEALPQLIRSIHGALCAVEQGAAPEPQTKLTPAVPIRKSVTPDWLLSLEDGRKFKALKRHLATRGMTPDDYRAKWGLPKDYPMVAPNYAAVRSENAKRIGLGQSGRKTAKKKRGSQQ
jgi:predicted transcriptional regulator